MKMGDIHRHIIAMHYFNSIYSGLVFLNSSDWRISKCVRLDECPAFIEEKVEGMTTTAPAESTSSSIKLSTTETPKQNQSVDVFSITESKCFYKDIEYVNFYPLNNLIDPSSSRCTLTNTDVGGQACELDTDCPVEQRCCHLTNSSLGEQAHRCACPDPHTIWSSCGSLCPEYCSQPAIPVCSTTCSPGCHCSPGFVKARNDITAPCIPREQCETIGSPSNDEPIAIMKEIPPSNPFGEQRVDLLKFSLFTCLNICNNNDLNNFF
uniref:TIL domain-containing protein n=1 Tax=Heterorhabditis bacteriophora TaxID=37862 RepID=A0A1I7XLZ1_HETBA